MAWMEAQPKLPAKQRLPREQLAQSACENRRRECSRRMHEKSSGPLSGESFVTDCSVLGYSSITRRDVCCALGRSSCMCLICGLAALVPTARALRSLWAIRRQEARVARQAQKLTSGRSASAASTTAWLLSGGNAEGSREGALSSADTWRTVGFSGRRLFVAPVAGASDAAGAARSRSRTHLQVLEQAHASGLNTSASAAALSQAGPSASRNASFKLVYPLAKA